MVRVIFVRDKNEYSVSMNGHARYSDVGNDIVCAAASTLGYTLWGFLENCGSVSEIDTVERTGEMEINCKGDKKIVKTAFDMALVGFLQLEKTYPKFVCVDADNYK